MVAYFKTSCRTELHEPSDCQLVFDDIFYCRFASLKFFYVCSQFPFHLAGAIKMLLCKLVLFAAAAVMLTKGQRPSYAGRRAIGYPQMDPNVEENLLSNRFGQDEPLPPQANNDRGLVYRISKLPTDKQPFWYLNWRQYEEMMRNPQTWPQRRSQFNDNNNSK